MVSIVQTSTTTSGNPVAFIPQMGAVVTSQGEVVALNGSLLYNITSNISNFCCGASSCSIAWGSIDIGIPSRSVFNVALSNGFNYVFYYDLEANQLISTTCGATNGLFYWYLVQYPTWFFTPWGEKLLAWMTPGNVYSGYQVGWIQLITRRWWDYPRIGSSAYYGGFTSPPGFYEDDGGPQNWGSSGYFNGNIYIIYHRQGATSTSSYGRVVSYPAYLVYFYGPYPAWLMNMVRQFTDQNFNNGNVSWGALFFDSGTLYTVEGAYNSSTGQCYYRVWRSSDGSTVTIGTVPCYNNWPYLRRVSQSNVLIAIYSATQSGSGPSQLTGIWELNLPNFSVTQVQGTITGVTGGNAYAFRDSSGYIHLIQISNQYIVKLYKQSQTQVQVVTTDVYGNPVSLTLNVYANQGWVNEFGGDRNQLIGQVTTNNNGVGYFTYTGPLSLLQFEYASPTEGYGYNYITLGVPQWKAIKLGPSDEYA
jgi:hypothetical protein